MRPSQKRLQKQWVFRTSPVCNSRRTLRRARTVIPGTTKLQRVEENIAAAEIELTTEDLQEIEESASHIKPQGA
ncbi:MAG: aldo/keto reductase, partial [Gaiellaceae bacterium]